MAHVRKYSINNGLTYNLVPRGAASTEAAGRIMSVAEVTGTAAYQVDPYNETELADALRCFARRDDLRHHHAAAGLQRAGLFSWKQTARQTLQVYQEVLDAH